jgi:hypothetical protein
MYTFYKSSNYYEGVSVPFEISNLRNSWGRRTLTHFFGPLRTFNVSLMRKIPLNEHLNEINNFLDTLYDTALQYPLF